MSDFYVTLVSNAQESSTISNFQTRLPSTLVFNKPYEVALSSIIYPTSHDLISNARETNGKLENEFFVTVGKTVYPCRVQKCTFSTPNQLIDILNHTFSKSVNTATNSTEKHTSTLFEYNSLFNRVTIKQMKNISSIELSDRLSYFLGIEKISTKFPINGQYPMFSGSDLMYIYSEDLVEPQTVSHMKAPLLKVISISPGNEGNIEQSFTKPIYVPVRVKECSRIGIQIKNDRDHFIPFNSGKIVVVLHFRPTKVTFDG
ncbi:hypothetical protein CRE_19684 [Caenorhabditis remanei]|uniref:Uncharacterized protein n=1 Tax=Caenorhabditis remanei TaxID=31234 RepID=E3MD42_CAERE|nr:hypothetical protein CRE_19684 [Caenorhabditis remanei]